MKSNPDSPQLPVRVRALKDGKLVYMAVPRLAEADPFFVLDPDQLADPPARAASIKHAARSARTIDFDAMTPVDLVVTGCVAVGEDGARLGKGGGFSDLEFALAAAAGLVDDHTVVVTTVHDVQVQPRGIDPGGRARHARRSRRDADAGAARAPSGRGPGARARLGRPDRREDRRHPGARAAARRPLVD